jgi:predicted transcriptional regulator
MTIGEVVESTREQRHRQYPVVSHEGSLIGILTAASIIRSVRDAKLETTVGELIEQPKVIARADESLHDVVARMALENVDRSVVLAADGSRRVVGFLSPSDIVSARLRRQGEAPERADITLF